MRSKVVAIMGSYRRHGITEQVVDAMFETLEREGVETQKIVLTEKQIGFCKNCRTCTEASPELRRGTCVIQDDMEEILSAIDAADGVVLAAPVNFGGVTAIMMRFIERLLVYMYWPWVKPFPVNRVKGSKKKAVLVTSSAAPVIINRLLMSFPLKVMRQAVSVMGARVQKTMYLGLVSRNAAQKLSNRQLRQAQAAARTLV